MNTTEKILDRPSGSVFEPVKRSGSSTEPLSSSRGNWRQLLIDTERGVTAGMRGDSAVFAQLFVSCVVVSGAVILNLDLGQWAVIVLALTVMLAMIFMQQGINILLRLLAESYPIETRQVSRIVTAAMSIMWIGTLCGIGLIFYQRLTVMLGTG